jgi:hypothetical protein
LSNNWVLTECYLNNTQMEPKYYLNEAHKRLDYDSEITQLISLNLEYYF